jgi:hypothetical protein
VKKLNGRTDLSPDLHALAATDELNYAIDIEH